MGEDADPAHQFQMIVRPLRRALVQENLEAALEFARHLLDVGGAPEVHEGRKVQYLLSALDGTSAAMRVEFMAQVVDRFGAELSEEARARLSAVFDRI